jgi:hypothetical protein
MVASKAARLMSNQDHDDFILELTSDQAGSNSGQVHVLDSPKGGSNPEPTTFPSPLDVTTRGVVRGMLSRDLDAPDGDPAARPDPVKLGEALWRSLFTPRVALLYEGCLDDARRAGRWLRVQLRLSSDDGRLQQLPWELLRNPAGKEHLAIQRGVSLTRSLNLKKKARARLRGPLRVLAVTASPKGMPALDLPAERSGIEAAVGWAWGVRITWLPGHTLAALASALEAGRFHVVHFSGHGDFAPDSGGTLLFEKDDGAPDPVSADRLYPLLEDHPTLLLAVLNSCSGASADRSDFMSSTATRLLGAGLVAVLAMQRPVADEAAVRLSGELYRRLGQGWPPEHALTEARKALHRDDLIDWATPALYTRDAWPGIPPRFPVWIYPAMAAAAAAPVVLCAAFGQPACVCGRAHDAGIDADASPDADAADAPDTDTHDADADAPHDADADAPHDADADAPPPPPPCNIGLVEGRINERVDRSHDFPSARQYQISINGRDVTVDGVPYPWGEPGCPRATYGHYKKAQQ